MDQIFQGDKDKKYLSRELCIMPKILILDENKILSTKIMKSIFLIIFQSFFKHKPN